jgi:hypothetical protein
VCRRASEVERREFAGCEWVIESQGLPNLIHELVHALFLGRLEDDHGFDYGDIPLDMDRPDHRQHLWEELACCGLSTTTCVQFWPDLPGADAQPTREAWARAWFAEQFEIQGVFHGLERDLAAFRAHIGRQIDHQARRAELESTVERGRALFQAALREVGAPFEVPPCDLVGLWRDYFHCATAKHSQD